MELPQGLTPFFATRILTTLFAKIFYVHYISRLKESQGFLLVFRGRRSNGEYPPSHFTPSIGTEELGHLEMIAAIVHQLTRSLTEEQLENNPGFASYFVDHTTGIYPTAASGFPWNAASMAVKGDPICDLTEDLAAEPALLHQEGGQETLENQGFFVIRAFCFCVCENPTKSIFSIGQAAP